MTNIKKKEERKAALARARTVLGANGNRMTLILGLFVCVFASVSIVLLISAISLFLDLDALYTQDPALAAILNGALTVLNDLLMLFLAFPLYLGLVSVALRARSGAPIETTSLFCFFDSPRSFFRGFAILIWVLARAFPFLTLRAALILQGTLQSELIYTIACCAALPSILLGLYTTGRSIPFLTLVLSDERLSLSEAMRIARAATARKTFSILVFRMQLLLKFLLSLLSVGVVTMIHVLPLMLLARHEYAVSLIESKEYHES